MSCCLAKWSFHGVCSRLPLPAGQELAGFLRSTLSFSPLSRSSRLLSTEEEREENTRYSSSSAPFFDFSEYLLSGSSWKHAPSVPDFVGPLSIKHTHDSRGRGLFTSATVRAGSILLASNPFALSFNDHNSMRLYHMITSMAKQSSRALHQLASLAGYCDEAVVPPVELFDPRVPLCYLMEPELLEFDPQRIANVMNTNCFGGEVKFSDLQPTAQLNGLWLLPSFVNHSCTPNANRLFVGKALLILASRDIPANEEITISYTDCLLPVHMREEQLESLGCGFSCECQRCVAERCLEEQLFDITEPFQALYDEAVTEVFSLVKRKDSCSTSLRACIELSNLFNSLTKRLESNLTMPSIQKRWILASYSYGFLGKCFANYLKDRQKLSLCASSRAMELVESMNHTVPGMMRTLSFIMMLAASAKQQGTDPELIQRLDNLAMGECIRVYGSQRMDAIYKLMEQSLHAIPYV